MKGLMRPKRVVVESPGFDDSPCFGQRFELVLIEAFVTKAPVEDETLVAVPPYALGSSR